jgi:signal transduction histidine kinase
LEQRLKEIDAQLATLANYSLGSGIGAIGYRSSSCPDENHPEWVEIDFGQSVPLDEVVLVPAIRRDAEMGFQADAFPMAFRLVAGNGADRTGGRVVAEYDAGSGILPRIAPLTIALDGGPAAWIRLETRQLSPRAFDGRHALQLAEILAFSGERNVALRRPAATSPNTDSSTAWGKKYLVDGVMPYLMDAAHGKQSVAYLNTDQQGEHPSLVIDLQERLPVSRIHLHAVDQSDTLPQAYAGDIGIPRRLLVEGADRADFSDAQTLLDLNMETIYDMGPIMMWSFPETRCRYIRLTSTEPSDASLYGESHPRFGFAEIEVFSHDRNVALGKPASASYSKSPQLRPLANLTDGRNMYGNILPIRDWLSQLALRHELESERPRVVAELNHGYAHQKATLRRMGWLAALLATGTAIIVLIDRIIRQRAIFRTREQIAADLHDELGANIHAIGLLGDLAQAAKQSPEKLDKLLQRMRALTERTGAAARYCTNLLEAEGLYEDLVEDMRRSSARIAADLSHSIAFEGEEMLRRLKPRKRIDLFLFYKECLINIIRHSGATEVSARLKADSRQLELVITDNGHGLNGEVPESLKRRARLLGAQVASGKSESGGTRISLRLKLKKFGALK